MYKDKSKLIKFLKMFYSNNQRMSLCPFLFQALYEKCLRLVSILLNSSQTDLKAYISGKSQILSPLLALRVFFITCEQSGGRAGFTLNFSSLDLCIPSICGLCCDY